MPVNNKCVYHGCENNSRNNKDVIFHRVSSEEWIERIGNKDLRGLTHAKLSERRICSAHFVDSDYITVGVGKKRLKNGAIPISVVGRVEDTSPALSDNPPNPCHNEHFALAEEQQNTHSDDANGTVDAISSTERRELLQKIEEQCVKNEEQRLKIEEQCVKIEQQSVKIEGQRVKIKVLNRKISRVQHARFRPKKLSVEEVIDGAAQHLSGERLFIVKMQLRHARKRKWDDEEKEVALQIWSRGPRVYRYLKNKRKMALPCNTLVRKWMNETVVTPGFNPVVFAKLEEKARVMEDYERDCTLMWDEMSIRELLEYDSRLDCVTGFEDLGEYGRSNRIGNHALVFMIRGLRSSWKQPIAYFIPHGTVRSQILKCMIDEAIHRVYDCGLRVRYMVCDQAQTNATAIRALMKAEKQVDVSTADSPLDDLAQDNANVDASLQEAQPFISFEGHKIYFGFDVPHLLKGLRNNLFANDYLLEEPKIRSEEETTLSDEGEGFASDQNSIVPTIPIAWAAIKELRELEKMSVVRAATKLTDRHLDMNRFSKMNVSMAAQIFSHSVAQALRTGNVTGELKHESCNVTADFLEKVNTLFDCLNARNHKDSSPFRRGLSLEYPHVEKNLNEALLWLANLKVKGGGRNPPTFANFQLTIKSILALWKDLQAEDVPYLLTGNLNQDPIENQFGFWRSQFGNNVNPSARQIRFCAQRSMFLEAKITPPKGANCRDDETTCLLGDEAATTTTSRLDVSSPNEQDNATKILRPPDDTEGDFEFEPVELTMHDVQTAGVKLSLKECSIRYVAGYIAQSCMKKFKCTVCHSFMSKPSKQLEIGNETLIFWRAYECKEGGDFGKLSVPTTEFNHVISAGFKIFEHNILPNLHNKKLQGHFRSIFRQWLIREYPQWFSDVSDTVCAYHRTHCIHLLSRLIVYYNLRWLSQALRDKPKSKRKSENGPKPNAKLKLLRHQ